MMSALWAIILMVINLILLVGTVCVLLMVNKQAARLAHLDEMSKQLMAEFKEHGWHEEEEDDEAEDTEAIDA